MNFLYKVPLSISLFPTVSIHHSSLILPPQPWESVVVRRTTKVDNWAAAVLIYNIWFFLRFYGKQRQHWYNCWILGLLKIFNFFPTLVLLKRWSSKNCSQFHAQYKILRWKVLYQRLQRKKYIYVCVCTHTHTHMAHVKA